MSLMQLFVRTLRYLHSDSPLMSFTQYTIGSFLSAVSLNIVSQQKPEDWRNAVLSQFALCGVAIIAWAFLPESARWHCIHGRETEAKKILQKVNGKVEGYDVDEEYRRMLTEVEHANVKASVQGGGSYLDVFKGVNRVSVSTVMISSLADRYASSVVSLSHSCRGTGRLPLAFQSSALTRAIFSIWLVWPTLSTAPSQRSRSH